MILEFSVSNFRSFAEEHRFSLVSNLPPSEDIGRTTDTSLLPKFGVLTTSVIYGPNASGKSNLLKAMRALKDLIISSKDYSLDEDIRLYMPFRLDSKTKTGDSKFNIEFIANDLFKEDIKRRYIFTVIFDNKVIKHESLYIFKSKKSSLVYYRDPQSPVKWGAYFSWKEKKKVSVLSNQLFLSAASNQQENNPLNVIYRFFRDSVKFDNLLTLVPANFNIQSSIPEQILNDDYESYMPSVEKILSSVDTGIRKISIKKSKSIKVPDSIPDDVKVFLEKALSKIPMAIHSTYKDGMETGTEAFDLGMESDGSQHLFNLSFKLIDALRNGSTFIIDELTMHLHPEVSKFIIELFHNKKINKNKAQLIFTTHDISILSSKIFLRDQIWFTEKNKFGATQLFSLLEFDKNEVRKNTNFGEWYLKGRFGAMPIIDKSIENFLAEAIKHA